MTLHSIPIITEGTEEKNHDDNEIHRDMDRSKMSKPRLTDTVDFLRCQEGLIET